MRLIDADALYEFIQDQMEKETGAYTRGKNKAFNIVKSALHNECAAPTIEAEPVKYGKWVAVECGTLCTNCRRVFDDNFQIPHHVCKELIRCPDCGAIMDGGNTE